MTLVPAYGRDYKSKKEVVASWEAGQDFLVAGLDPESGRPFNIQSARDAKIPQVTIRYKKLTQVCMLQVK